MLLATGREVVSKTSAYNITKLSYRVEVRVRCVKRSSGNCPRRLMSSKANAQLLGNPVRVYANAETTDTSDVNARVRLSTNTNARN